MRNDTPESISSASQMVQNTMVWPKSGCFIKNSAMTPVMTPDSGITGSVLSCARIESIHAMATTKHGFRNSDGWTRAMP